jgi:hypothetical protein
MIAWFAPLIALMKRFGRVVETMIACIKRYDCVDNL